ncbi:O-succinylbenzoic acid--CoA ligase [Conyzicola lurida]|uniref:O-succinylbenzoic acid--CoA ligase n=1 Tax=Conyzicola lurida TaxID=1172621 RepID=A0A841ASP4_9MICO|nr:AMP-binding protein [Conyzicola lurida]MBB5844595.1 O-succinylbenzoic acid--CoA ligase [Conyzicola lurida]
MTRALRQFGGEQMLDALRHALGGDGPAVFAGESSSPLPESVPTRVALVVESSGSTGTPKRVALSSDALLASAAASDTALGGPGQWLLALPTTYIAGINVLVRSLSAETAPVELAPGHFSADAFIAAAGVMDHPQRYTSLVPAQLSRLIETDAALGALRRFDRILVGGQATPLPLIAAALELGLNVTRTYGSSETSGGCVYDGVPIGATRARVVDGQIELSGAVLAEGYLGDPERTDRAFHSEQGQRWYRTGDQGEIVDGVLSVTGRLDDVIISGGLKVSLGALERLVRDLPGLGDAVIVRETSERWGEVPVLVATVDYRIDDLKALVTERLGRAAVPARVVRLDSMPLLSSGKPDRVAVRAAIAE